MEVNGDLATAAASGDLNVSFYALSVQLKTNVIDCIEMGTRVTIIPTF